MKIDRERREKQIERSGAEIQRERLSERERETKRGKGRGRGI